MKTLEEKKRFFAEHSDSIKNAAAAGGADAVIAVIRGFTEDSQRRVLYVFARRALVLGDGNDIDFDVYIRVCDAGIEDILKQAESAPDEETRRARLHTLHVISYNLAADLADCWPDDDAPRTEAHHHRGIRAAEDCLRWTRERDGGAHPLSISYWALGIRRFSLGQTTATIEAWEKSLEYANKEAEAKSQGTNVDANGAFGVVLGAGWLGLARWRDGDDGGRMQYEEAVAAFKAQLDDPAKKEDAGFGIGQLEKIKTKSLLSG